MIERVGDMFEEYLDPRTVYVITTNGYVRNDGCAVMGRGTAKAAADLQPTLPRILGDLLLTYGNRPYVLPGNFVSLPVKHKWDEKADLDLIQDSLTMFCNLYAVYGWQFNGRQVYVPWPGIGNGRLAKQIVEPIVEAWLGDYDNIVMWSLGQ